MHTAQDYFAAIQKLLPQGAIWELIEGEDLANITNALADFFARIDARIDDLPHEFDSRETIDLITDFETDYGLPRCGFVSESLSARRDMIRQRFLTEGRCDHDYYIALAALLGFEISIQPTATFEIGDPVGGFFGDGEPHTLEITIHESGFDFLLAGEFAGELLVEGELPSIECILRKEVHGYIALEFVYE